MRKLSAAFALALALAAGCAPEPDWGPASPPPGSPLASGEFRVAILANAAAAEIAVSGPYEIRKEGEPAILETGAALPPTVFRAAAGGLEGSTPSGRRIWPSPIEIRPRADGTLSIANARYRGRAVLYANPDGTIDAVNAVALESYIHGVVGGEMPASSAPEALAAQAIAARSYALYKMRAAAPGKRWIGASDASFQVYKGIRAETASTRDAVLRTAGLVLLWQGRAFPAYYHSTCGGRTRDVALAFGERSIPPLAGGTCGFCDRAPRFRWNARVDRSEAATRLGVPRVDVMEMVPQAGAPARVRVRTSSGSALWTREALRARLGPMRIFGYDFTVRTGRDGFDFAGSGFGHGVGLCQEGARGMATAGRTHPQILAHYYPGADLVRIQP
ncbi:MAG: SpoIID/LytB domain-containing protein [Planctomycetota bacterium]